MARFQKGEHNGKEFSKDYQPKNRRKPKIFNVLKKSWGMDVDLKASLEEFSREQIKDILTSVLYTDPRETLILNKKLNNEFKKIQEQLQRGEEPEIAKDSKLWQVFIAFNTAIQKETITGRSDTVRWILEYLLGKATQPIEGDITSTSVSANQDLSMLSNEELNQYLELQRKIQAGSGQ